MQIEKKVSSGYVVKVQGESNEATQVMRYNINKMTEEDEDEDESENQSVSNFESEKFSSEAEENSRPRKQFHFFAVVSLPNVDIPRDNTMRVDVANNQGLEQVPMYYQPRGNQLSIVVGASPRYNEAAEYGQANLPSNRSQRGNNQREPSARGSN